MRCPICGHELQSERVCPTCGSKQKLVTLSYESNQEKKRFPLLPALSGLLVLCIVAGLGTFLWPQQQAQPHNTHSYTKPQPTQPIMEVSSGGFVTYQTHIVLSRPGFGSPDAIIVQDNHILTDTLASTTITSEQRSLDGKTLAFINYSLRISEGSEFLDDFTGSPALYVVREEKIYEVAQNIQSFQLSTDGTTLVYLTTADKSGIQALVVYHVLDGSSEILTQGRMSIRSFCVSPDGKTVAYQEYKDVFLCLEDNVYEYMGSMDAQLVAISNNGYVIYALDYEKSIVYVLRNQAYFQHKFSGAELLLSADHSQMMIYDQGVTYVSTGIEFLKVSDSQLTPMLPANTIRLRNGRLVTLPSESLYRCVYSGYDRRTPVACLLEEEGISVLTRSSHSFFYDPQHRYLYFFFSDKLQRVDLWNPTDPITKEVICQNMENWFLDFDADRGTLFYLSNHSLLEKNPDMPYASALRGENVKDTKDYVPFACGPDGYVYYFKENDLYAAFQGNMDLPVAQDVDRIYKSPNGLVYYETSGYHVFLLNGTNSQKLPGIGLLKIAEITIDSGSGT